MNIFFHIISFLISSILFGDSIEIISISNSFTIDTIKPQIELYSPSHGDYYGPGDNIQITWSASDDSPAENPMKLNVSANLDNPYIQIGPYFPNVGNFEIGVPGHINTLFASIRLDIVDYYGNKSYAYSSGYFTLGNPNENIYQVDEEAILIESISNSFIIDTKPPEVSLIFPNESRIFNPNQPQVVRWSAADEHLLPHPINIYFKDGGVDSYLLAESITNNGLTLINIPNIQTTLGQFEVRAKDSFGNISHDLSDEYMTVGLEDDLITEQNVIIESISEPFEMDTKKPQFNLINETDYFYPNGGELFTDYNNVNLNWNASDNSFENGQVEVSLAYLLGGWYLPIGRFDVDDIHSANVDFSFNGLVENTIWARLIFTAIDDYGNTSSQYSDDYFTLGSSDGDISADLYDEDNIDMFVTWTWDNNKHRVKIKPSALENFNSDSQIVIVGENSVKSTDCETPSGIADLGFSQIEQYGINEINIANHIVLKEGVNHCDSGGGSLPGYSYGDSIRIKIIESDTSYFLRPSNYRGSLVFNNTGTIIKEFDTNPYNFIERYEENLVMVDNSRDWDQFNVYGKITNHQGSTRACDNDGVCDKSELIAEYTNESSCLLNSGEWNGSLCYYDFNNDGTYSPAEVDENIADCYIDCCNQPGIGQNDGWCYIETVNTEEYTHSLVQNNYVPATTTNATVNYRVWLLDNGLNEIYKTVDTEDYEIQIGTDEIPDYINNLNQGWNWISFNIENEDDMSINNIFSNSELSNSDFIKSQTTNSIYYASGDTWYPNWQMNIKNLYLINLNESTSIIYNGIYNNPADIEIDIASGWNWIGYTPSSSQSINSALSNFTATNQDFIKGQTSNSIYYESGGIWYPDMILEPNKGYMIKASTEQSLFYPEINSNNYYSLERKNYEPDFNYRNFQYNSSITIELNMPHLEITENDIIKAYYDNEIRGIVKADICPLNDKILFNLMLYSNNLYDNGLDLVYINKNTGSEYLLREKLDFEKDSIIGNALNPIILTDAAIPNKNELSAPYPNPFNPLTTINFSLINDENNLIINIYDLRGRLVETLYSGFMSSGYHDINWNASNHSSGIYFVKMNTSSNSFIKKITLIK